MMSSETLAWRQDSTDPSQKNPSRKLQHPRHRGRGHKSSYCRKQLRRPLPPELVAQIRAEGYGRAYVQKQIRKKTPMVFELYGEHVEGIIIRRLTYALDVVESGDVRRIEKINIKYMYKRDQTPQPLPSVEIDPELKAQNLISVARQSERFQVDDRVLPRCHREKIPVRLTLRGGEIITGIIDWFSQYEIKITLPYGASVVVFRHGLHSFEISPQWVGRNT